MMDRQTGQTVIDAVPTIQLMEFVRAKRSGFYKAIAHLNIKTFMNGKTSMVSEADAQRLMDYYAPKTTLDIRTMSPITLAELNQTNKQDIRSISLTEQTEQTNEQIMPLDQAEAPALIQLCHAIAQLIPAAKPDLFAPQRALLERLNMLECAAEKGWILSTKEITQLVGMKTMPHPPERYGFKFERAGKQGGAIGWRVTKA